MWSKHESHGGRWDFSKFVSMGNFILIRLKIKFYQNAEQSSHSWNLEPYNWLASRLGKVKLKSWAVSMPEIVEYGLLWHLAVCGMGLGNLPSPFWEYLKDLIRDRCFCLGDVAAWPSKTMIFIWQIYCNRNYRGIIEIYN